MYLGYKFYIVTIHLIYTIMEKYDISTVLLKFYKKYKHEKFIRNWEETLKTTKGFLGRNFLKSKVGGDDIELKGGSVFTSVHPKDEDFIFSLEKNRVFFYKRFVLINRNPSLKIGLDYLKVDYSNYNNLKLNYKKTLGVEYPYYKLSHEGDNNDFSGNPLMDMSGHKIYKELDSIIRNIDLQNHICKIYKEYIIDLDKNIKKELQKIKSLKLELIKEHDDCKILINDIKKTQGKKLDLNKIEIKLNEQKRMIEVNSRFLNNESVISDLDLLKDLNKKFVLIRRNPSLKTGIDYLKVELNKLNNLKQSQTNVLSELDKDGNGEVDVIEGNDFNLLLKKHQKSIVEVDRTYVQQFVKISGYLKTKEKNIQTIFNLIKDTPNQKVLKEYVEVLKDDIHSYNLILFNSLNMIVSLVEDDMITFYEIHEMFDTLNMFDSKHEKDISQKLTNIGDGLESLIYEIRDMGNKISNSIDELTYVTEQSNEQLENQLSEIDSTMKVGNLINTINTYQNYKNNRRLNS